MSDSNRLLFAAAAIGLIACALIWGVAGVGLLLRSQQHADAYYQVDDQRGGNEYQSYRTAVRLTEAECAKAREQSGTQSEQSTQRDLCAQYIAAAAARRSANYAQAQTWIGVFGFGFVIVGLVLNWIATKAATEQTEIARQQLINVDRPELFADVKDSDIKDTLLHTIPLAIVTATITNAGERSAIFERVHTKLHASAYPPKPQTIVDDIPRFERRNILGTDKSLDVPVAGRTEPVTVAAVLDESVALHVLGYVVYRDRWGTEWEMGFCFRWWFVKVDGEIGPNGWEMFGGESHNFDRLREKKRA